MLGLVVFGFLTWIWTTAAPALAASTQEFAICSGVTGTAGFLPGELADPVTAHEMITLRCMAVTLLREAWGARKRVYARVRPAHKRVDARLNVPWNPTQGPLARRSPGPVAGQPQAKFPAACLTLCAALSQLKSRSWNESELFQGRFRPAAPHRRPGFEGGFPIGARLREVRVAMSELLLDYLPLVIFIAVAMVIGVALLVVPFLVAFKQPDPEKLSAYECGFNAFDDARMKFDVRFYLVAILFIIFDLEVSFLFPWAIAFGELGLFGFWSMMVFLGVLTIGFIYEWRKGALEWD